ncbi:hypothetical protein LCGC14_1475990 [marine sediment metagenome]|uniref:Uncharacterized protein n=1 Tax=marine sediment metagenome TaxID=412755 RepID=A0A0F9JAY7_9ZZZZ
MNSSKPIPPSDSGVPDWAAEYLAASMTMDMTRDPDDPLVTRQSKVSINGLLFPLAEEDENQLIRLFRVYEGLFQVARLIASDERRHVLPNGDLGLGGDPVPIPNSLILTGRMRQMILRAEKRSRGKDVEAFTYISIDPQDYTIFSCHKLKDIPVIKIHTRPDPCWFLGALRFEGGGLGLNMGRMRVTRNRTPAGGYLTTIRTKYRALTNKVKQEEARDAYQRLIQSA